jgi:hypothetical protein
MLRLNSKKRVLAISPHPACKRADLPIKGRYEAAQWKTPSLPLVGRAGDAKGIAGVGGDFRSLIGAVERRNDGFAHLACADGAAAVLLDVGCAQALIEHLGDSRLDSLRRIS